MLWLYTLLTGALVLSGLVMNALMFFYQSPSGEARRLANPDDRRRKGRPVADPKFRRMAIMNSVVSIGLVYGLTYLLYPFIFSDSPVSLWRIVGEGIAVLVLYDFFYYLVHRYPFHEWKLLRRVHAVHHVVKHTSAVDSLYLHPVENFLGLSLLWACATVVAVVVAPVHIYSFTWAFVVYSLLNIVIHSGMRLPAVPFAPINYLTERHSKHHASMKAKNYSSVSPVCDIIFGTEIRRAH